MKHLKSYTIVPNAYYVERDADRQIRSIIDDMGRPGYVLVARQMGKTNLLLHTKSCLENEKNIFVYVDFTTVNEDNERDCFQTIIDTAIMTHPLTYAEEKRVIMQNRKDLVMSPQKQFTSELLILLQRVDKLVIVLDEIDALTNCPYSDKIFSQIRGHYFQRVNFQELEKLTYILSGVIEPKKIIKDPNISPFNIGEKIYLKDFTKPEFRKFVTNIELDKQLSLDLLDYIYFWTNGHPRMTWDVCQEIEENENIKSKADIDSIIKKIYLTTFDHAPIDGIRKQISEDRALARAAIELSIHKGQTISEDMRNQLYLAGVIDYSEDAVQFKNPVMEKSLEYSWLLSLQTREQAYLQEAIHCITFEKDYKGAESKLTTLLQSPKVEEIGKIHFYLGICNMHQYKWKDALSHFADIREEDPDYFEGLYWTGYCYQIFHQWDRALETYNMIEKSSDRELRKKTIIAYAEVLWSTGDIDKINQANNLLLNLLNTLKKENVNIQLSVLIYFNMAIVSHLRGDEHGAISSIDYAINFAQANERPLLLHYKLQLMKNCEESEAIAVQMINSLDAIQNKPDVDNIENKLASTQYTLSLEIAEILLNYPHLESKVEPKLKLLYEKREDAFFTILMMLVNPNYRQSYQTEDASYAFAELMVERYHSGWTFTAGQILRAYSVLIKAYKFNETPELFYWDVYSILSENLSVNDVDPILARSIIFVMRQSCEKWSYQQFDVALEVYKRYFAKLDDPQITQFSMCIYYYYTCHFYANRQIQPFFQYGLQFMQMITNFMDENSEMDLDISKGDIAKYIYQLKKYGAHLRDIGGINAIIEQKYGKIHNSRRVKVMDKVTQTERIEKFRKVRDDIRSGFVEFIDIAD